MRIVIKLSEGLVDQVLYDADDDPGLSIIVMNDDVEGLEDDEVTEINGRDFILREDEPIKSKKKVDEIFREMIMENLKGRG